MVGWQEASEESSQGELVGLPTRKQKAMERNLRAGEMWDSRHAGEAQAVRTPALREVGQNEGGRLQPQFWTAPTFVFCKLFP